MCDFKFYIERLADGKILTREEATKAFSLILSGEASSVQMGAFLMALRVRKETMDEILGALMAMRQNMLTVEIDQDAQDALDIVGTGGDFSCSYNVSTASAFVVSGAGVKVAKHGNRAISSKSGAADTLQALGVNIQASPEVIAHCIKKVGLGFMFAPNHHPAMRSVLKVRAELGTRTLFNLLGPLSNPAMVRKQLIGVFSPEWVLLFARILKNLGSTSSWVVHGGGLDEISTVNETIVACLKNGELSTFRVTPEEVGLQRADPNALKGGDTPEQNAAALRAVLNGVENAYRDIVLFNSAAALLVADKVNDLKEGMALAAYSIDSGNAEKVLDRLIHVSNQEDSIE
ncbi:MAG: anthranilate phosphoribosyltransferase [Candidatus Tokpelaia sp. JSC161]|nr:MAG: anthranilate phosphoribosyltransferase [Candidatus Tokpelaia sp. JSC161]